MNMKTQSRTWIRIVLKVVPMFAGSAILIAIIAAVAGVFSTKIPPGQETRVHRKIAEGEQMEAVHEIIKEYFEEAVGTLKAAERTEISSRILAPIREITVRAGQSVQAEEVLVKLDPRATEARLRQAQSTVTAAEAALINAEKEFQRNKNLIEARAVSRASLEKAETERNVARAKLEQAKDALSEAEVLLSYNTIKAPRAGRVVDRLAEPGDTARPGVPLLVLYDPSSLRLEVPVPESLAVQLKQGDRLTVRVDALNREVEAVVDEIVPQAEVASRSLLVKAAVPQIEGLVEGMFGRLLVPAGKRRHLCIPTTALFNVGQLEFVDVVKEDNSLERRMIKTGRRGFPGRIEVISGLEAGEKVRISGNRSNRDEAE